MLFAAASLKLYKNCSRVLWNISYIIQVLTLADKINVHLSLLKKLYVILDSYRPHVSPIHVIIIVWVFKSACTHVLSHIQCITLRSCEHLSMVPFLWPIDDLLKTYLISVAWSSVVSTITLLLLPHGISWFHTTSKKNRYSANICAKYEHTYYISTYFTTIGKHKLYTGPI